MCTDNPPKRRLRTWSHVFCALATMNCTSVPNQQQLIDLQSCGLGLKEVTFYLHDDAEAAQSKLLRYLRLFAHRQHIIITIIIIINNTYIALNIVSTANALQCQCPQLNNTVFSNLLKADSDKRKSASSVGRSMLDWLRRCSCLHSMCESVAREVNSSKTSTAVDAWPVMMSAHGTQTGMVGPCRGGTCRPERTA